MMTKEELDEILRTLEIDVDAPANQIYVFFVRPDGRVDNFSLTVHKGRKMSDAQIETLMRREYPTTREGRVLAVERPEWRPPQQQWLDTVEVCNLLKVSSRTLRSWAAEGLLRPRSIERRNYYRRQDIDRLLEGNAMTEGHRLDRRGLADADTRQQH